MKPEDRIIVALDTSDMELSKDDVLVDLMERCMFKPIKDMSESIEIAQALGELAQDNLEERT